MEAAVNADINLLRQAALMDPLTGAVCTPREIFQMIDEMLIAQAQWLPQYKEEIERAKIRFADPEGHIPPKDYKGIRLQEKTVEQMRENKEEARKNAAEADKAKERPSE